LSGIHYSREDPADVYIMFAMKQTLSLGFKLVNLTPFELMSADDGIDITDLRKRFKGTPFVNGNMTNEQIGAICGNIIEAALNERR
jgi:hypothetical protein